MVAVPIAYEVWILIGALATLLTYMGIKNMFGPLLETLQWVLGPVGIFVQLVTDPVLGRIADNAKPWADDAATTVGHWIAAVPEGLTQLGDAVIAWAEAVVASLLGLGGTVATVVTQSVITLIQSQLATLRADVNTLYNQGLPDLKWFIQAVQAELWDAVHGIEGRLDAFDPKLTGAIDAAIAGALAAIGVPLGLLRNELLGRVQGVEAGIDDKIDRRATAIDGEITGVRDDLTRQIDGVKTALADAIPGIDEKIKAATGPIVATATATAVEIATLTKWIAECGEPLCVHYGPDIPFLDTLAKLLEAGAVAAWVTAAIVDPEGTADVTDTYVQQPIATVANTFMAIAA